MRIVTYGSTAWRKLMRDLPRSSHARPEVQRAVAAIVGSVRRGGDTGLLRATRRFDGVDLRPSEIKVPPREVRALARQAEPALQRSLSRMAGRIRAFHRKQVEKGFEIVWSDGSRLAEVVRPLDSVGLYVPGGAGAYPSSVLMNAIPALVAGVPRLVVVTPPRALASNPAIAAALVCVGLERSVFRVGGAQAVAALAYGTKSVPRVAKIVGPGNAYVAEAKRQVRGMVEIDQEAGPSEVVVLADETADPGFVAVDLLAQAEHGTGQEAAVLITPSRTLAEEVVRLVADGLGAAANRAATRRAMRRHGAVVLVRNMEEGLAAANEIAAEHVEIQARHGLRLARRVVGAAVFVGSHTPVAVGDYGAGPNHVLPTGGSARATSPLSVRDFQRRQSLVSLTAAGLRSVAGDTVRVARAEGFEAHAQSVLTRLQG